MELKWIIWITPRKRNHLSKKKLQKGSNLYGFMSPLSGQCPSVVHHVNSLKRRKAKINMVLSVLSIILFFSPLCQELINNFRYDNYHKSQRLFALRLFSTAGRTRGCTNYCILMIYENNNSSCTATRKAREWLEAESFMSNRVNKCHCPNATVNEGTGYFRRLCYWALPARHWVTGSSKTCMQYDPHTHSYKQKV